MNILSLSLTLFAAAVVSGCASQPRADKLSEAESEKFFSLEAAEKGSAIVFFTCGEWRVDSWLSKTTNPLQVCALEVNGTPYKQLNGRDLVGRLTLQPGTYKMQSATGDSLATYIPIQLELKSGDVILVTQHFTHKVGPLGGALSGGFTHSLEWTKESVPQKISRKTPHAM